MQVTTAVGITSRNRWSSTLPYGKKGKTSQVLYGKSRRGVCKPVRFGIVERRLSCLVVSLRAEFPENYDLKIILS